MNDIHDNPIKHGWANLVRVTAAPRSPRRLACGERQSIIPRYLRLLTTSACLFPAATLLNAQSASPPPTTNSIPAPAAPTAEQASAQLWITNAHGNDIHIYEIDTWKLLQRIEVGPSPHGISATADGRVVHISIENPDAQNGELVWIDTKTRTITGRINVGPEPHEIECTADGQWIYVPCNDGTYWVIDGFARKVVKTIKTGGQPHNTTISPDQRFMYLSPMGRKVRIEGKKRRLGPESVTVVEIQNDHQVVGEIKFKDHPRPAAIGNDGLLLYQNIDDLTGFQVADTTTRKVVAKVKHELNPELEDRESRCHGLAIRPGNTSPEIWCADVDRHRVHIHETASGNYKQIATIPLIGRCYWITFSPDGRYAFVSIRSENSVAVINTDTRQVVTYLKAGDTPKRTQVILVPIE